MSQTTTSSKPKNSYSHLIGGFFGGLTSSVILQPFDLIKTRVQQQQQGNSLRTTIRGITSYKELWRGTLPSALRTSVGSGLYLSSLNVFRSALANAKIHNNTRSKAITDTQISSSSLPKLSMTENLLTGSLTRGFVGWLTMPITIIKVRYESTLYNYNSITEAVRSIRQTEGIRGFFSGFLATAARDAPYAGIYVLLYEKLKIIVPKIVDLNEDSKDGHKGSKFQLFNTTTSALINSISAFSAASLATTLTAPFDTIKTRMQLNPLKFKRFTQTGLDILKNESALRLFDGLSLRLTRKAFSAGIAWGIYEEIIKYFDSSDGLSTNKRLQ